MRVAGGRDLKSGSFFPALKQIRLWDLIFGRGHVESCIRPFTIDQKRVQMIIIGICGTFQQVTYFSYGLDVEIRPK